MKLEESPLARRRFLWGLIGGGTAALGGGAVGPVVQYAGNFRRQPLPEFVELGPDELAIPPGESKIVMYGPLPVLLIRPADPAAAWKIFLATCTHLDCTVHYEPDQQAIICACHDGRFDLEGRVVAGPPPAPLPALPYRSRDDRLIIALEQEHLDKAP